MDESIKGQIKEIGKTYEANADGRGDYSMGEARQDMASSFGVDSWTRLSTQQRKSANVWFQEGRALESSYHAR
jgi:hypothetical protein